jgi:hypothetical protein
MSRSRVSQVIFILIVLYCVASVNVLILALGMLPYYESIQGVSYLLIGFTISSFVLTLFISAYHLSTMLRRRKRRSDRLLEEERVYKN